MAVFELRETGPDGTETGAETGTEAAPVGRIQSERELLGLILRSLVREERLSLDDTLTRHTGKRIASAGMHRDPLLSTAQQPFWHFGHNWVVLAVVIHVEAWNKTFSLPVVARLYRTEKTNRKLGLKHRPKTELASELIALVATELPDRRLGLSATTPT